MNILITGGAGFIGSNLVAHMVKTYANYTIVNFDKLTYAGNLESLKSVEGSKNYHFIKGDICDKVKVNEVFEEFKIDAVMHLAAESHVDRSILGPEEFLNTNMHGTFVMLEAARKYWNDNEAAEGIRRVFLNVSTDEVYGSLGAEGTFTEDSPYAPNSPYSASKAGADHLVRAYFKTYELPTVITHCSNNYGPYQFPEKLIPLMILNAIEGKDLPVYGDGLNVRDWIHVEDHCIALDMALHKGRLGETYNVGSDNEWENIRLVRTLCAILDEVSGASPVKPHEGLIKYVNDRPGHDLRYSIDSSKIKRELGWEASVSFEEGLRDTVKWYLGNLDWYERLRSGEYQDYYSKNYADR